MAEETQSAFEQKVDRLETIVRELESGNVEVDRAVALFNEGKTLARQCDELLKAAQKQIDEAMATAQSGEQTPS